MVGAVGSPRILQIVAGGRSPIHLGKIGVPVVHEARGVGKNMQNTITPGLLTAGRRRDRIERSRGLA